MNEGMTGRARLLNEFAAACLGFAERRLCAEGAVKGIVSFAYHMEGLTGAPELSEYELAFEDAEEADREMERIEAYARATKAEAVSVVMEVRAGGLDGGFMAGKDGALVVAAVSAEGEVGIVRPYARSGEGFVFADPVLADSFPVPVLSGIFRRVF